MTSFWDRPGVLYRAANDWTVGPSEAFPILEQKGYGWVAFDPSTAIWDAERKLAATHNLPVVPWTRCRQAIDLDLLTGARIKWGSKAIIPNIEIGSGGTGSTRDPALMLAALIAMSHAGSGCLVTDGWADPIGNWQGYKRWTGSPEVFPEQDRRLTDLDGCLLHASAFFKRAIPCLGAYGTTWLGRKPVLSDYQALTKHPPLTSWIVAFGDDIQDWSKW